MFESLTGCGMFAWLVGWLQDYLFVWLRCVFCLRVAWCVSLFTLVMCFVVVSIVERCVRSALFDCSVCLLCYLGLFVCLFVCLCRLWPVLRCC